MARHINPGGPSRLYSSWLKGNLVIGGGDVGPGNEYFVDGTNGHARNDGLSWERAKALIQDGINLCSGLGNTVYVGPGEYAESVVLPETATTSYNTLIGMTSTDRGYCAAITSAAVDAPTIRVRGPGWRITGLEINCPTQEAGIRLDRDWTGQDSSFTQIDHCHITGGHYGVSGNGAPSYVLIKDNLFDFILETSGRAITCTAVGASQPNMWFVEGNDFNVNDNHIYMPNPYNPMNITIKYNTFAAGYHGGLTTQKVNIGTGGFSTISFNTLGGTFSIAGGYKGGDNDDWFGNACSTGMNNTTDPI